MIPEVLISKYLDGELSLEEDVEFRALLGADPEAREAFDSAVLLHIAMRCEDDTAIPTDVNERVLAFIDSTPMYAQNSPAENRVNSDPSRDPSFVLRSVASPSLGSDPSSSQQSVASDLYPALSVRGLKSRGSRARRVFAVAAMLLVLALPIGEQLLNSQRGLVHIDSVETSERGSTKETASTSSSRYGSSVDQNTASVNQNTASVNQNTTSVNQNSASIKQPSVEQPMLAKQQQLGTEGSFGAVDSMRPSADQRFAPVTFSSRVETIETVTPTLHALFATSDLPPAANVPGAAAKPTILLVDEPSIDVLVATSYSQSVAAPSEGAVTTVAAGIGYGVADNTFVGMELGSTRYTRTTETSRFVENESSDRISDAAEPRQSHSGPMRQFSKVTFDSPVVPQYRTTVHTSTSGEGTLWGAAFVQHALLKTGLLSINGRVGAGVGEDGMLTYGRMQAECNLFSSVSLTIGAEARYSPFRTGVIGGQPMARTYGTVISALYGLQVRL